MVSHNLQKIDMICPYYKNKEVFDGFNEIIEAFGGKPMTEEEFRSADLRNERTGRNFSAMEAAYIIYDRNGGNLLDMTPTGLPSILFLTLLDYNNGDRIKAIVQKSNVYSKNFFNWFGDWTQDSKENVSKVVDENGEPLVVWHTNSSIDDRNRIKIFDRKTRRSRGKWLYYFSSNKDSSQSYLRRLNSDEVVFDKNKTIRDILLYLKPYYRSGVNKIVENFNIDIEDDFDDDQQSFTTLPNEDALWDDIMSYIESELVRIIGSPHKRKTSYNGVLVDYNHYKEQSIEDQRIAHDYSEILETLTVAKDFRNSNFSNKKEWNTYAVYLNIRSIFELDANGKNWDLFEYDVRREHGKYLEDYYLEQRKSTNSDGLLVKNYIDTYDYSDDRRIISTTYAVDGSNLIKHVENLGTWSTTNNDINRIVVGEHGAASLDTELEVNTRIDNLSIAREMETSGVNASLIKIATGWERGVDGKWRYEIPDIALKKDKFGFYSMYDIVGHDKNNAAERPIEEVIDLTNLPQNYREELEYVGYIKIYSDFLDGERGSYYMDNGKVIFSINLYYDESGDESAKSIITHELQHFIQDREGFGGGGNPSSARIAYLKQNDLFDKYRSLLEESTKNSPSRLLMKILSDDDLYVKYENMSRTLDRVLDMIDFSDDVNEEDVFLFIKKFIPEYERGTNYDLLANNRKEEIISANRQLLKEAEKKYDEILDLIHEIDRSIPESYTLYKRLSGEVEARTAASRIYLSEQERRNSLFTEEMYKDVAKKDLIFLEEGLESLKKNIPITRTIQNGLLFEDASISDFGIDIMSRLKNEESVLSGELVEQLLFNNSLSADNIELANILLRHNIPVKLDSSIGTFTLATTETDKSTGRSIILLNPNLINSITKGYLGEAILHEIIHAVTVNAINNPQTSTEKRFVYLNKKVFDVMRKAFPKHSELFNSVDLGTYALTNEKEFAAVFITDSAARDIFYNIAKLIDVQRSGKFLNTLKNFVNSIVHLFVNKNIFNTNESTLKQYQTEFLNYLIGVPTQKAQRLSIKQLKDIYDSMNNRSIETESLIDKMNYVQKYVDAVERNNIQTITLSNKATKEEDRTYGFDDIVQKLQIRVNALRTSDMKQSLKNKYINDTKTQIDMFRNQLTAKYVAITSTLRQVIPQVLKDVRELKNINLDISKSLSGSEYMYQMHSNIAMYNNIAQTLLGLLNLNSSNEQIISEYNRGLPEDLRISIKDLEEVKHSTLDLVSITQEGMAILKILRDRTAKDILRKKAEKEGNIEDMNEYIQNITENPTFDDNISSFEMWLGSMDSASNDALRALSSIVNRALKRADDLVIDRTVKLLELQSNLKVGESVVMLYETDDKGFTTGYLIRKLNYGKFYKAYDEELKRINKEISNVTGKILEDGERVAPDDDTILTSQQLSTLGLSKLIGTEVSVRLAWNELKNIWLNDNCERKYNKKYYDAWNRVPRVAKDALDSINTEIASILAQPGVLGKDGYNHYEVLSDQDWNTLQDLWIQKKLLRSDYDMFGNLKQEGSTEYKIAKALQQLSKDLYGDTLLKIKKDKKAWLDALNNEIEACGGKEAYDKWERKEKNHGFNVKRFKKWHLRNSRLEFKKDENGNAKIFQDIENAMQGMSVDYGKEYNDLKDRINELLKPYRAQNGEINASELPDSVKNLLNELYSEQYEIRQKVFSNNRALKDLANKYKEVFDQFIKFEDTEYYKQIKREIRKASTQEDGTINYDLHDALLESYGRFVIDYETGIEIGFLPHRWLQRMQAIDSKQYMEYQPGDAWTEKIDNEDLLNKNFDPNENSAFVPKKSKYDNSKKFAKIENSPTLKALYDEVVKTMAEANAMLSNRMYADNFLLPQITGSIWKRMKRHSAWGKTKALFKYLAESIGIGYNPNDFSQIGSNMALDEYDSDGSVTTNDTPIQGLYPDERTFHILPQYYTRRMEDPSLISSDLINILSNYYKMSAYYKEKVAIKDDCETIVDFLEQRKTKSTKTMFKRGKNKDKSRLFNAAEKFLEMNLYDMRRSNTSFNIGPIELLWSKTVSLWKTWTTRRNLGMNPKVALTGFLTTIGTHILGTISGQNYGKEGVYAFGEVVRRLFQNYMGAKYLGNPLSDDDMMVMAENFNIAGQALRKWENTNMNRLVRVAYKNSVFGFLSTIDFWSKSIIMVSILMNHHYVNGKFLSREDIRNSRYLYSTKEEFNKVMQDWKQGPNLYSLLKSKDHRLYVDDKYKAAWELAKDVIKDRVQKTTEYADGMATDLQRAAITQSVIGALVLIHKQYLPLITQRYFGKRVYDYDTHQYKNGVFRTLFNIVGQIMQNNLAAGIGAGVFTGVAFGGGIGALIGGAAAFGVRAYGAHQHKNGKESKSLKLIFDENFNDFSDKKSTAISYSNRYNIKDVIATVIGYRIIVLPIVGLVCSIADNDDDDTWWLLLLAYALRAFEWEYYTAFRTDDMLNNVKSPTAATSVIDAIESFGGSITNTIAPQGNFLFDPSQSWDDFENIFGGKNKEIQKGAYEGWLPWQRDIVKGTAFHNLYEQLKNSKAKRKYQENQIMRINKSDSK